MYCGSLEKNDIVCYRSGGFLISSEIAAQWASRIQGPGREIDVRYMIPISDAIHPRVEGHGAACELVGNEELNYMVITQSEFLGLYSPNLATFEDFERGEKEDAVEQFLKGEGKSTLV